MAVRFGASLPDALGELRYEPRPQRVRIQLDGQPVADTTDVYLVWEPRRVVPLYAVPWHDFSADVERVGEVALDLDKLPPALPPGRFGSHTSPGDLVDITIGGRRISGAAFAPSDPDLGDRVIVDFSPFEWLEEEERAIGHPHDPFKRIDILSSSRHVIVSVDGVVLADSTSPTMLIETHLPVRWYLPRSDVRLDLLKPTETDTICAYKGHASYWSYEAAGDEGRDLAWTYVDPLHEALPVKDLICFFSERSDTIVDGVRQERPQSFWRKPDFS